MFPAAVVVDIQPAPAAPERAVVIQRCSAVLAAANASCASADSELSPVDAPWFVAVAWDGAELNEATVSLHEVNAGGALVRTQRLNFQAESPGEERWAAVGLVVAAMSTSADRRERVRDTSPPAPGRNVRRDQGATDPPAPQPSSYVLRLAIAPTLGSALSSRALAVGGTARVGLRFGDFPIEPTLAGSYAQAQGRAELRFFELAAGAEWPLLAESFELRLRAEAGWVRVQATASDDTRSETDEGSRFGGEFGVSIAAPYAEHHAVWAGAGLSARWPRVQLSVKDARLTRGTVFGYRMAFGLEFRF